MSNSPTKLQAQSFKTVIQKIIPTYKKLDDYAVVLDNSENPVNNIDFVQEDLKKQFDLKRTTKKFISMITEYNNVIDQKIPQKERPQKSSQLKRYARDKGAITNYHIVLNWQNLNPLFQELQNKPRTISPFNQRKKVSHRKDLPTSITLESIEQKEITLKSQLLNHLFKTQPCTQFYNDYRGQKNQIITNSTKQTIFSETHNDKEVFISPINYQDFNYQKKKNSTFIEQDIQEKLFQKQINNDDLNTIKHNKIEIDFNTIQLPSQPINKDNLKRRQTLVIKDQIHPKEEESLLRIKRNKEIIKKFVKLKSPRYFHPGGTKLLFENTKENQNLWRRTSFQQKRKMEKEELIDNIRTMEGPPVMMKSICQTAEEEMVDMQVTRVMKQFYKKNS